MKCEINTTHFMSTFCLDAWKNGTDINGIEGCFPTFIEDFGTIIAVWCIINAVIGEHSHMISDIPS